VKQLTANLHIGVQEGGVNNVHIQGLPSGIHDFIDMPAEAGLHSKCAQEPAEPPRFGLPQQRAPYLERPRFSLKETPSGVHNKRINYLLFGCKTK
jgi:hypothetical protein